MGDIMRENKIKRRIAVIKDIILEAQIKGRFVIKERLICQLVLNWGRSRREIMELIKPLVVMGEVIEEKTPDGIILKVNNTQQPEPIEDVTDEF